MLRTVYKNIEQYYPIFTMLYVHTHFDKFRGRTRSFGKYVCIQIAIVDYRDNIDWENLDDCEY